MEFRFTPYAVEEMQEPGIPLHIVLTVLNEPAQITPVQNERSAYQSEVMINDKPYLVRAIVEADGTVVTVYRTSKLRKYWSEE